MPIKSWFHVCLVMFWHYEIRARIIKAIGYVNSFLRGAYPGLYPPYKSDMTYNYRTDEWDW